MVIRFAETLPDDEYRIELIGFSSQASATTDFNSGGAAVVRFTAVSAGLAGNGVSVVLTKSDRGATGGVGISVTRDAVSLDLNTNAGDRTTAQGLVDAIKNHVQASAVISAVLESGAGTADITTPLTPTTLALSGAFGSPLKNLGGAAFNSGDRPVRRFFA